MKAQGLSPRAIAADMQAKGHQISHVGVTASPEKRAARVSGSCGADASDPAVGPGNPLKQIRFNSERYGLWVI